MIKNITFLTLLCVLLFSACEPLEVSSPEPVGIVDGVKPIYAAEDDWDLIESSDPRPIQNLGKIYYKDQLIYVNERNKGIHIIDNTNPETPIPIYFISIPGSEDIAIKGNILYADNITDLVAIDISDINNVQVVKRIEGLYPDSKKTYPDGYSGYFECVDETLGIVIGWEETLLDNPTCFR